MRLTFLFILLIQSSALTAQSPFEGEIQWGPPAQSKSVYGEPMGKAGDHLYYLTRTGTNTFVDDYDVSTLTKVSTSKFILEYQKNKLEYLTSFAANDKLYVITRFKNKSQETNYYFIHEYLGAGGLSDPKPIANINVDGVSKFAVSQKSMAKLIRYYMGFSFTQSENGQHFAFIYPDQIEPSDKNSWTVKVFNAAMEEEAVYKLELAYTDFLMSKIKVTDDGIVYGLGLTEIDTDMTYGQDLNAAMNEFTTNRVINIGGKNTYFLKIDPKGQTHQIKPIDTGSEREVSGISLDISKNGPVIYGLYGTTLVEAATASFFIQLDSNGEIVFNSIYDFEGGLITKGTKYESYKGTSGMKKNRMKRFILGDLIEDKNGNLLMTAEHYSYYMTSGPANSFGSNGGPTAVGNGGIGTSSMPQSHYFFGDVMVICCTSEGKTVWADIIQKSQHSLDDMGLTSSYCTISADNRFYVIFNDTEFNTDEDLQNAAGSEKRKAKHNRVVAAVAYDASGKSEKFVLEDNETKEEIRIIVPSACKKISDTEFLLFATNYGQMAAGLAKLKK